MPFYDFRCPKGHTHEARTSVDVHEHTCPACDAPAGRQMTADVGFRMGREGLLNTRNLPNDGVHRVGDRRKRKSYPVS